MSSHLVATFPDLKRRGALYWGTYYLYHSQHYKYVYVCANLCTLVNLLSGVQGKRPL